MDYRTSSLGLSPPRCTSETKITGALDVGGSIQTIQSGEEVMQPTLKDSMDLTGWGMEAESSEVATQPASPPIETEPTTAIPDGSLGNAVSPPGGHNLEI